MAKPSVIQPPFPRITLPNENTIVLFGDSITAQDSLDTSSAAGSSKWLATGVFNWVNYLLGQRFRVVARSGVSGDKTVDALARINSDVLAYRPRYCWVEIGINDPVNAVSSTTSITNLTAILATLIGAGIIPIVCTLPPSASIDSNSEAENYALINRFLRDYAKNTGKIILIDVDWPYVDTTGSYPTPLAGYTDGVVHPYTKGAIVWAQRAAAILSAIIPNPPLFHNFGSVAFSSTDTLMVTNPLMIGTGGTASTGVTGNVATSWTAVVDTAPANPGAIVASKVARTDAPGAWQQFAFTGSTGFTAQDTGVLFNSTTVNLPAGVAVGDTVAAFAEMQMDTGQTSFMSASLRLRFNGTSNWAYGMHYETSAQYVALGQDWPNGILATPEMVIPASTTGLSIFFRFMASAASAAFTARVGRVQVRKIG